MFDDFGQIIGHFRIAVCVKTRAIAVVAHIHNNNVARIAKPFGDHAPISGRPIKTMGDEKRGTRPEFIVF